MDSYMTRIADEYVGLLTRTACINNMKCDLSVSIHCNASENRAADYIATYIQASGGEAEKLAQKVQARLVAATGWPDGGVKVANLAMTRDTNMPAILAECGFISNPGQEQRLADPAVQGRIAAAIAGGIMDYLGIEGEAVPVAEDWKHKIINDAKTAGLITGDHNPDDPAPKWFVLAVALKLLAK
jgi:N-acetylmuramoyl-L-alanine amidase